jgi:multiple sugar transport system permease protein
MSIISEIGRKSFKVKLLYFTIYSTLTIGALTMVYPFMLMLSGSTKSAVDVKYFDAVPRFFYDDAWLYKKYVEALFNERLSVVNQSYGKNIMSMEEITLPESSNQLLIDEFNQFVKQAKVPRYSYTVGFMVAFVSKTMPKNLRLFKDWLAAKYGDDIDDLNRQLGTEFMDWNSLRPIEEEYLVRRRRPVLTPFVNAITQFKESLPATEWYYFSLIGFYRKDFIMNEYGNDIAKYNKAHNTAFDNYQQLNLPSKYPTNATAKIKSDWEYFVRNIAGIQYLRIDKSIAPEYHKFLKIKHDDIATLNRRYNTNYATFNAIKIPTVLPFSGMSATDWNEFIAGWKDPLSNKIYKIPITKISLSSLEFSFQHYLQKKFSTISKVNKNLGTSYLTFADVVIPQQDIHFAYFNRHKGAIKWEFIKRNYITVSDYIVFHGRGVMNTVIYCLLAVISALLINPLAAYAMSRYKLASTYKILLFLLCTMAFPPMVTAIPNFLMLRSLGLLNTFAALILPGMANGYAIFLLKGFFDSQPRELYESAALDGASEWTLFWNITMSLSKPILAVIALQAFNLAYANFMFAFVVCQDEKMWTLMVWLYQLKQISGTAVMYASLIIAAIPTLIIFLFCQNMIMRGIVVPSEK